MKYIIDIEEKPLCVFDKDTKTYFPRLWRVKGFNSLVFDEEGLSRLEELTADYINEHFGDLQDEAYQRGLEDGKQTAIGAAELREKLEYQKGFEDGKAQSEKDCVGCMWEGNPYDACEQCSNAYKNLWTAKQKTDEIKIGDEVIDKDGDKTIVTNIHGGLFDGLCYDGSTMSDLFLDDVDKTGRHFNIDKILEELRHEP